MIKTKIPMHVNKEDVREMLKMNEQKEVITLNEKEFETLVNKEYDLLNGITLKEINPYSSQTSKNIAEYNYEKLFDKYLERQYDYYLLTVAFTLETSVTKKEYKTLLLDYLNKHYEREFNQEKNILPLSETVIKNIENKEKKMSKEEQSILVNQIIKDIIKSWKESRIKAGYRSNEEIKGKRVS